MTPYYTDDSVTLYAGDCLDVLRELPDASVDAVVTDPPYGLEFMGRTWDSHENPAAFQQWCELWTAECLRVLKPGGHLLAFGGTRTWHRLACAVEDAGFEVRDSIAWLYGSGFPKSLDVSKAIDKARNDRPEILAVTTRLAELAEAAGITRAGLDEAMGTSDMGGRWLSRLPHRCACPSVENWARLRDIIPGATELDAQVWRLNGRKGQPGEAWDQREKIGEKTSAIATPGDADRYTVGGSRSVLVDITAPATPDAERWQGWGTALKPAFEPIVVARKPLAGTVARNVLEHGTGALNIDGCRIEGPPSGLKPYVRGSETEVYNGTDGAPDRRLGAGAPVTFSDHPAGRWPANVALDEDQADALDRQSGESASKSGGLSTKALGVMNDDAWVARDVPRTGHDDSGGVSRFFYTAKADAGERVRINGVSHPTVKPLALMRWLVRLVTPPGGTVLEPFAGSGATVEACILEGFRCIAIEREADYLPLIVQRINRRRDPVAAIKATGDDGGLFDLLGEETA